MANPVVKYVLELDDKASGPLKDTGDAAKDAADGTDTASVSMAGLAGAAATAAAAIAATTVAWVTMMQHTADAVNDLNDMSVRTGVAADTLKGLKLAAEGSGLELSAFESGLSKLPKRMHDAQGGMKEVLDAFNELGVAFEDESGTLRDTDTVFREIAESLSEMENETQRGALAADLLGRSGKNLMQALGTHELDDFITSAERFGTDVGPAASKAADDWQRQMALLGGVTDSIGDSMARAFGFEGAAGALETFNFALVYTSELAGGILSALKGAIVELSRTMALLAQGDIEGANKAAAAWDQHMTALSGVHETAKDAAAEFQRMSDLVGGVSDMPRKAVEVLTGGVERLKEAAKGATDAAKDTAIEFGAIAESTRQDWQIEQINFGKLTIENLKQMNAEAAESQRIIREANENAAALALGQAGAVSISAGAGALSTLAGGDLIGAAGGVAAFAGADPYSAAIVGGLQALIAVGEAGNDAIVEGIEAQLDALQAGIENLPELIPLITDAIISAVPSIMEALVAAAPMILWEIGKLILYDLPNAIADAIAVLFEGILEGPRSWAQENWPGWGGISIGGGGGNSGPLANLAERLGIGSFQSGGFVPRTQLALLHQGETVIPAGGGGGINISTSVLDRDAIPALVRQIERVYGSFGRASSPLFAGG